MILKKTKISKKYQTVIPSIVRTRLGLEALDHINFVETEDGRIYLEKSIDNAKIFNENGLDFIALAKILLSTNSPLVLEGDETKLAFKNLLIESLSTELAAKTDLILSTTDAFESAEIKILEDTTRYTVIITDTDNLLKKNMNYTLISFKDGTVQTIKRIVQSKASIIYDGEI